MDAHLRKSFEQPFILYDSDINKIWNLLETKIGIVTIEMKANDSIVRTAAASTDLLNFENSINNVIKRIDFEAKDDLYTKRCSVSFDGDRYQTIEIYVKGDEKFVSDLNTNLNEIIIGLKPWYSLFCKIDFSLIFLIVLMSFLGIISLEIFIKFLSGDLPKDSEVKVTLDYVTIAYMFFISFMMLSFISYLIHFLNKLREKYFPVANFAVGQGIERNRVHEKIRWGVVVTFFVSIASSMFVAFVY